MAERLSESQMLKLAQLYKHNSCLWDVKHALYKSRRARDLAYSEIWRLLDIPGLTVADVPKKIKNLRSSYYSEVRRIAKSMREGADEDTAYTPKISWFSIADEYLKAVRYKLRKPSSQVVGNDNAYTSCSDSEGDTVDFLDGPVYNDQQAINTIDDGEQNAIGEPQSAIPTWRQTPESKDPLGKVDSIGTWRHIQEPKETKVDYVDAIIAKLDSIAENITKNMNTPRRQMEDEFDGFGKYIAMTLRCMPPEFAIVTKTELQKTLSKIQLTMLRRMHPNSASYGTPTATAQDGTHTVYLNASGSFIDEEVDRKSPSLTFTTG